MGLLPLLLLLQVSQPVRRRKQAFALCIMMMNYDDALFYALCIMHFMHLCMMLNFHMLAYAYDI